MTFDSRIVRTSCMCKLETMAMKILTKAKEDLETDLLNSLRTCKCERVQDEEVGIDNY